MSDKEQTKIDTLDFLPAIQRCGYQLLPATLGEYAVKVIAHGYLVQESAELGADLYTSAVALKGRVKLEASPVPALVGDVPLLAKLPWVKVEVAATDPLTVSMNHPRTGKPQGVLLKSPNQSMYFVPAKAFLPAIWNKYHVNLISLRATLLAIQYEPQSSKTDWVQTRSVLGQRAFGHSQDVGRELFSDPADQNGEIDRQLPDFDHPWDYLTREEVEARLKELKDTPDSKEAKDLTELLDAHRNAPYTEQEHELERHKNFGKDNINPPINPFPCNVSAYYSLTDAYYLVAFLELVEAKEIPLELPAHDCALFFKENGEEKAEAYLMDTWEAPSSPAIPLEALKQYGKTVTDNISELFRYRHDLSVLRDRRRKLLDEAFSLGFTPPGGEYVRKLTKEDSAKQHDLITEARKFYAQDTAIQAKAISLYATLTEWACKRKEKILKKLRERDAAAVRIIAGTEAIDRRGLTPLPSNMGRLPAHFAAIPSGLESGLHLEKDQYGRAILRVRRQGLHLAGQAPTPEQLPFALQLGSEQDAEHSVALAQAQLLFGANGPRWLVPQGIVAISKLYSDQGGYNGAESVVRIYENEWVDTMRPRQIERFAQKGRGEAFGKGHKPKDLFPALLGVLTRLTYDSKTKSPLAGWSELNGFYLIISNGEDSGGRWTEVMLNPALHRFIAGDGGLPYMICNTKAMFEYDRASLDYAPAAQMGMEQFARTNLYKRNTTTLSDPQGGGITRLDYAQRWGILRGPSENNKDVLKRFNRVLDTLGNVGIISEVKVDGQDHAGGRAFETKLLITMHSDYRTAYDLGREKDKFASLDRELQAPFADPQKVKGEYNKANTKGKKRPQKAK